MVAAAESTPRRYSRDQGRQELLGELHYGLRSYSLTNKSFFLAVGFASILSSQ